MLCVRFLLILNMIQDITTPPLPDIYYQMLIKKTKVAIVVPVYNVAPYLNECLDSILTQTYTNFTVFLRLMTVPPMSPGPFLMSGHRRTHVSS
ncbi:glycosyltransferase [Sutterella wadsworthensis]|uniref:glycosyltransferase n=1 Tax=Sutterella wadsworthensis TaxID=40545 RepID=UPI003C6F0F0C